MVYGVQVPGLTRDTQRVAVRGSLPAWLIGTLSRAILHSPPSMEPAHGAHLHTFSFRGGRVSYAHRQTNLHAPDMEISYLADPARTHFSPLVTVFSHTPADHARSMMSRADAHLAAYRVQPLPVEFEPALGIPQPPFAPATPNTLLARAGIGAGEVRVYHAKPRGIERFASVAAEPTPYLASLCQTPHYLVITMLPFICDTTRLSEARGLIDCYRWMPALGAQFVVLERETGKIVGRWDADAFFAFHTVQAFERGGELVVDLVAYPDASVITQPEQPAQGILRRYRLMPGARRAPFDIMSNVCIELPRGANRVAHGEQSVVYGVSRHIPQEGVASALSGYNQLVRIDLNSGRDRIWTAAGCSPGEPIIVRRPGAKRDDDGVVLSLVWDAAREAAFMLVLDATSFAEIGRAALPQTSMRMETDHIPYTLIQ